MRNLLEKVREHPFPVRVTAFLAMILASAALYFVIGNRGESLVWGLIGVVVLANILAMFV